MKLKIILLLLILSLGCSTNKEAIQKGYLYFDKDAAIRSGIEVILLGGSGLLIGSSADNGARWDLELMGLKYPECFRKDGAGLFLGWESSLFCVQEKAKEEGSWR